jgi:hypothetical protein
MSQDEAKRAGPRVRMTLTCDGCPEVRMRPYTAGFHLVGRYCDLVGNYLVAETPANCPHADEVRGKDMRGIEVPEV